MLCFGEMPPEEICTKLQPKGFNCWAKLAVSSGVHPPSNQSLAEIRIPNTP